MLASCGNDGDDTTGPRTVPEPKPLMAKEAQVIVHTQDAVGDYCSKIAASGGREPTAFQFEAISNQLERLTELAHRKPNDFTKSGTSPELALGDIGENLEGTNCDERLVRLIDAELAEINEEEERRLEGG